MLSQISQIYWDLGYGVEGVATYLATITNKNVMVQLFIRPVTGLISVLACVLLLSLQQGFTQCESVGWEETWQHSWMCHAPGADFSGMLAR